MTAFYLIHHKNNKDRNSHKFNNNMSKQIKQSRKYFIDAQNVHNTKPKRNIVTPFKNDNDNSKDNSTDISRNNNNKKNKNKAKRKYIRIYQTFYTFITNQYAMAGTYI